MPCRCRLAAVGLLTLVATGAMGDEPLPRHALARMGSYRFYHGPGVHTAVFAPHGKIIASASMDAFSYADKDAQAGYEKTIILWDSATGERLRELHVPHAPVYTLSFSRDGKQLAAGFGTEAKRSGIALFDVASGKLLKQLAEDRRGPTSFSTDGKSLLLSQYFERVVVRVDIASGQRVRSWEAPAKGSKWLKGREYVCDSVPAPDGRFIAWLVDDPPDYSKVPPGVHVPPHVASPTALIVVDGESSKPLYRKEFARRRLDRFAFIGDGRHFLVGGDTLAAYESATSKQRFDLPAPGTYRVACSADGRLAVTMTGHSQIRLWDLRTPAASHELLSGLIPVMSSFATDQVFSADGKSVVIATLSTLRLFDTATGKERLPLGHRSRVTPRFSADGKMLRTTCDELRRTWDVTNRSAPRLIREARRNPWEGVCGATVVAHSDDGRYFVAGRGDHKLQLCDTATGKVVRDLQGNPHPIRGWFSHDSTRLLIWYGGIAEDFNGFRLYDVQTGKKTGEMKTPSRVGYDPTISADGRLIAWADDTHAVHLHDGASGKRLRTLRSVQPLETLECNDARLLFSPDCTRLIATTYHHEILRKPDGVKWRTLPTRVFRVADGAEIGRFYSNPAMTTRALRSACSACSPDGRMLAVAEEESPTIRVIELASGKVRVEFTGHRHGVHGLAFSPDSRTLASGGADAVVMLWDVFERE